MFNKLLLEAGEFGLYQKCITSAVMVLSIVSVCFTYWTQVFMLLVPPHRCKLHWNDTVYSDHTNFTDHCVIPELKPNSQSINNELFNKSTTSCQYGYVYNLTDMFPTFATEHNLVCEDALKMYTIHTCYWLGAMAGSLLMGFYTDKYGRKKSYQISLAILLLADVSTYFSNSVPLFMASRFFSAAGSTNVIICGYVLAVEYTPPRFRMLNLALLTFPFTLFSFLIPIMAYYLHNWRLILTLCWVMPSLGLIITLFVPESAVWLLTKKRYEEVAKIIYKIAKFNGKPMDLQYIKDTLARQYSNSRKNEQCELNRQFSYSEVTIGLFRTPNMRRKTIILCFLWMMATMSYMGNTLEFMNLPYPWYLSFALGGLVELPSNVFCVLAVDKIGKRWSNFAALFVGGVVEIASWLILTDPITLMVLAMIGRMCFAAGYDISMAQSSECFPTVVRGRGVAFMRAFGMIANSIAPLIVSLGEHDKLLPLVIFGALGVVASILNLFLPETSGQNLPHTLEDGEEFGKDQSFFLCPYIEKRNRKT